MSVDLAWWWEAGLEGGGVAFQPWQFQPETYGALGNGRVTADVTSNGTTTYASATISADAAAVGKFIMIHGANGTTSGPVIGTITGVNPGAGTFTVSGSAAGASVANCPAVWGTDDTAAINSAITAASSYAQTFSATSPGSGGYFFEIVFGAKIYILGTGPTQTGNGSSTPTFNSQIPLPFPAADGHTQKLIIVLTGASDNGWNQYWESSVPNVAGTALVSMLVGPTNADPTFGRQSVVGGPTGASGFTSGLGTAFANVKAVVKGMSVWLPILTNTRAWDFGFCSAARAQQSNAHIFAPTGADNKGVQPYQKNLPGTLNVGGTGSAGWVMPVNQNNTDVTMSDCAVAGYGFGFSVADWLVADHLTSVYCDTAMFINQGGGIGHLIHVGQLDAEAYNHGVRTSGSGTQTCAIDINLFTECASVTADVDDSGNYFRGILHFQDAADASRGITVNGAANLKIIFDQLGPGHMASPPSVPLSTSSAALIYRDATVVVHTGAGVTVSAITVDGTATSQTVAAGSSSVPIRVPSGKTIALTYAGGTPTWDWWLD